MTPIHYNGNVKGLEKKTGLLCVCSANGIHSREQRQTSPWASPFGVRRMEEREGQWLQAQGGLSSDESELFLPQTKPSNSVSWKSVIDKTRLWQTSELTWKIHFKKLHQEEKRKGIYYGLLLYKFIPQLAPACPPKKVQVRHFESIQSTKLLFHCVE